MEKHVDYDDNFSPTSGIALARMMVSLAVANDLEVHSVDIEQVFTQADKLPSSPRACTKRWMHIEGFDTIGFEDRYGGDQQTASMRTISMCQRTWMIDL